MPRTFAYVRVVGAFGGGFLLCCSETHPLPYMPTRPFRVNAGAVSSYVLSSVERTNYLSELCQGDSVTGVRVNGETRPPDLSQSWGRAEKAPWQGPDQAAIPNRVATKGA
jgi:3-amino-4-hydroxybenzoic acid synthase